MSSSKARKPASLPKSDGDADVQAYIARQPWFLAFSGFQRHIKFSFFKGALREPVPPVGQSSDVRALDVRESDELDEKRLAAWIIPAAAMPGWDGGSTRYGGTKR